MKNTARIATILAVGAIAYALGAISGNVFAVPRQYPLDAAVNLTRACSHADETPKTIVSGANGATGSTGAVAAGAFTITCLNNACLGQSSVSASVAITKSLNSTCNYLAKGVPYWFVGEVSTDVIGISAATGESPSNCWWTKCH